ncbi:transmembrane gamma-carboxyglutamic acid protein 3 isoform X1 [Trachemys scripta elegans]|uniref:transmembrane gamma-carboxyglutamic acid protein 3 isoform X1 n=1 Tax=Trachemys scripta elegans TaxID=31138 RepID=UPI0015531DC1|nr:transmembrane gamma-carboxyglutamic acid protein 3 isoform X1 [Trachemys scripta elegans]
MESRNPLLCWQEDQGFWLTSLSAYILPPDRTPTQSLPVVLEAEDTIFYQHGFHSIIVGWREPGGCEVGESPECLSKAAWQPDVLLHGTEAACGAPLRAEDSAGSEARLGEARDLAGVSGSAWGMPGSRPNSGDSGRAEPAGGPGGRGLLCARSQYSTVDVPEQGTAQVAQWWKGWQTLGPGKAGNRLVTSGNTEGDSKELRANVPVQGGGGSEMCCLDPSSLSGGGRGAGARLFPAR